jgi:MFS transporter, DHA1 family, quinolone resistance protein
MTKQISRLMVFNRTSHFFLLGLIFPIFSLAILARGANLMQLGLLMGIYSATTLLIELPTGSLADTMGRKNVYVLSQFIRILFLLALLFSRSFPSLCIALALMGVSRALASGSLEAHFIDELYRSEPGLDIQPYMTRLHIAIPMGIGVGSLIGGFLPQIASFFRPEIADERLYDLNIMVLICFTTLHIILTYILVKEKKPEILGHPLIEGVRQVPEMISSSVKFGMKSPVILLMLGGVLFWGLSISGLEQLWQPRVREILPNPEQTAILGLLSFGYFASSSLGGMLTAPLCRLFKYNYPIILFIVRLLMGLSFLVLASRVSLVGFTTFYFLTFSFNGMANGPEETVLNDAIPSEKRATLLSFSSLFLQAGGLIGSILHGYLAETSSIGLSWTVAAVLLMISSVLYLLIPANKKDSLNGI